MLVCHLLGRLCMGHSSSSRASAGRRRRWGHVSRAVDRSGGEEGFWGVLVSRVDGAMVVEEDEERRRCGRRTGG